MNSPSPDLLLSPADEILEGNQPQLECSYEESTHEATQRKPTPLPKSQLSVLLYIELANPMTSRIILPFMVKLVQETGITGGDYTKVGYYVGFVESFYYITEALMILQWGRISDRIGRRPVVLTGLFGLAVSMLWFGLAHTFWAVVASRAIAGALDGNLGVLKSVMSEITDETNIAHGFSFVPIVWSVANTIGPLIGGLLQHPYERFGGIFEYRFWKTNPYFLPCLVAMSFSTSAFVLAYHLLKETAPSVVNTHRSQDIRVKLGLNGILASDMPPGVQFTETTPLVAPEVLSSRGPTMSLRAILTQRVIVVILNYSLIALIDMAYTMMRPLFLGTAIESGGLGMSPSTIGLYLSVFGILKGVVSVLFFTPLERRFGTRNVCTACVMAYAVSYVFDPVMNRLARGQGALGLSVWCLLSVQLVFASFALMAFTSPARSAIGATNGLAQATTSIMCAIAPAGASALFALSMERNLLGGTLVYVVFFGLSVCTMAASALLPARPWRRADD